MRADVAWVPIAGTWARQSRPGVRGDEPSHSDARWQHAETAAAYFAGSDATAWAELYRGLAERGLAPEQAFPRELHHVRVNLVRVADLSRERARRVFGLPRMNQSQAQWPAFQEVGEQLAAQGAQGILYASAARTRSLCLCVSRPGSPGSASKVRPCACSRRPRRRVGCAPNSRSSRGRPRGLTQDHSCSWMAIAIRTGEQTRQVQMVCLDELVADDDVLRRSHAGDCLQ
jgi:RES domain-containing protein